jgi:O-antigen ligase
LVSWLRIVQTASIAFLAANVIETKRDVRVVLYAIAAATAVGVVVAAVSGGDLLAGRSRGGTLGPNALGLMSGLLLLIAAFGGITRNSVYRLVLAAVAVVGLLLAKSVASFVATGFALALGASLLSTSAHAASQRTLRTVLAFSLAAVLVFSVVQSVRPEATPNSSSFRESSTAQRIILGATGLEIFAHNPIIGVGWRESSSPAVTGDREIATAIRRKFPNARPIFYPDVTPGSVHNTYVQVLADLGLIGFALFAAMILTIARRVTRLLRDLGRDHELWPQASVMALGLLLVLIWWNDNPLFGGQPETVIPALLVGSLAAIARMVSSASAGSRSG